MTWSNREVKENIETYVGKDAGVLRSDALKVGDVGKDFVRKGKQRIERQ